MPETPQSDLQVIMCAGTPEWQPGKIRGKEWCWKEQIQKVDGTEVAKAGCLHVLQEIADSACVDPQAILNGNSVLLGEYSATVEKCETCLGGCGNRPRMDLVAGARSRSITAESLEQLIREVRHMMPPRKTRT